MSEDSPLRGKETRDFTEKDDCYQMGKPPLRVDIMMSIPGVDSEKAWKNRMIVELAGFEIPFISRSDLIRAKEASGKPQDRIDIKSLKEGEQPDLIDES